MKHLIVLFYVMGMVLASECVIAKPTKNVHGSVKDTGNASLSGVSHDKLTYVGRDADKTGPQSKSDGFDDTHLQWVRTFNKDDVLNGVEAYWESNPTEAEKHSTGWDAKSDQWRLIVLADGRSLNDNAPLSRGTIKLKGKVRLDLYIPFNNDRYKTKGSIYTVKLKYQDATGKLNEVIKSAVVK